MRYHFLSYYRICRWEHSRLKRLGIALGRLAMCSDIVTDALVTHSLWRTQKDRPILFMMGLFFLLLQYVVIWAVLFKPLRRLAAETSYKPSFGLFVVVYMLLGLPTIICMDVLLFTIYLFSELEDKTFLIYYERMRVLCETLLEALPESIFQLSIWRAGYYRGEDPLLLVCLRYSLFRSNLFPPSTFLWAFPLPVCSNASTSSSTEHANGTFLCGRMHGRS